jgi:PAS domain S-box-containing protein
VLDAEGIYTYVSPAAERLLGHDPETLVGESGFEYVHPEDRERVRDAFEDVLENPERTLTAEYRVRDADGEWRWVESRGTNRLDDPAVEGIVLNSREITDRRERQRRLSEERAFTESVFAALPDVFYAFDENGNFLRWNDRLSEVTGYDDAEIRSMHPVEFVAPEDRPAVVDAITRVFEAGTTVTVEARFRTKDGETRPYEFTGAKMTRDDGELLGLVGIGRDISERKRRRRRFEAVFDTTPQFVGLTDTDGTVLEANETVREFTDVDREAFVGRKLWETEWFRGTDEAAAAAREGIERAAAGEAYAAEIEVEGAARETIDFSVRPITDDHGEITLLVPVGQRITDLKRRERHLQVLHRFLRHNLRNKMTVIRGTADVLEERLSDPTDRDHVSQIEGAATELIDLSETAHQLSRVAIGGDGERRPVDLQGTLATVRADVEREYDGATVRLGAGLDHSVRADWRLQPVFEQLVENAVEHADHETPTVEITGAERDASVSVRIVDDGPGIPQDELVGITTDEDPTQLTHGTGFGLWLVRSVVDDYGGTVEYEPRPEGGSIVTVELPTAVDRPEPADEPTDHG